MARRRRSGPKTKRVSYELIAEQGIVGATMYRMLRELVEAHHEDLHDARIALAWCTSWKADVDGRITLGKCKKASDLDREFAPFDFVILLQQDFWRMSSVTPEQRRALLDHELCHAAVAHDKYGEPKYDDRGRKVYRTRKHDIEEFGAIVERHGLWKRDLEQFAAALRRSAMAGFQACDECRDTPGWVSAAGGAVKRCECFVAWQAARRAATESGLTPPDGRDRKPVEPTLHLNDGTAEETPTAH